MKILTTIICLLSVGAVFAQHQHGAAVSAGTATRQKTAQRTGSRVEYHLYVNDTIANISGKRKVSALAVNGQIPAPTLRFKEGDTAVIYVHNLLHHETSFHWHGLLLPNKEDGVPYLTTAPVEPGGEYTFVFPLIQSGTYWYHSHTMLQEQSGLYGSIVIEPKEQTYSVAKDFVVLLSDWTDEKPRRVLNTLKRNDLASEWYSIKKGYAQSFDKLLKHKSLGSRLRNGWKRMPPMDLSDVYYDAFLANGIRKAQIPDVKPGDKIRLRVINGSSSTYFYLHSGSGKLELISADGIDVKPVVVDRLLMGIAETYDFILTVPKDKTIEFRATAQDVSGSASLYVGKGDTLRAMPIAKPNVWDMDEMMMSMAVNFPGRMNHSGMGKMKMDSGMGHEGMNMQEMDHSKMNMDAAPKKTDDKEFDKKSLDMEKMDHSQMDHSKMKMDAKKTGEEESQKESSDMQETDHSKMDYSRMDMNGETLSNQNLTMFNYDLLSAKQKTAFDTSRPVRTVHLRLTGSMYRYVWSINNKVLSQADKIGIKKGEIVRFELENKTMMNHPMHLHGHYFRVLNKKDEFSPLKHTLDVPPMTSVTIEFDATEDKDWFFHCHVLYHMMSGMARIVEYEGSTRDTSLARYPLKRLLREDKMWFFYGSAAAKSHMAEVRANLINRSNAFRLEANYNYGSQYEANISYERYIGDWFRPYIGFGAVKQRYYNVFNGEKTFEQDFNLPVIGVRYTLPFFIDADLRINSDGRVRFALEGEEWLLPKLFFTWRINTDKEYHLDLEYMLGKYISLSGGYDSRYKLGGGLLVRF
ncbi:multicopper oxidase domain-containing protein [Dyadobacter jiangsuensis]